MDSPETRPGGLAGLMHDFGEWFQIHCLDTGTYVAYKRPMPNGIPAITADSEQQMRDELDARVHGGNASL